MLEYWNRLFLLWELNPLYIHVEKGFNYHIVDDKRTAESFNIKMRLEHDIIATIVMFVDENIKSSVLYAIYHDNELVVSGNKLLEEIIVDLRRVIERVENDGV